MQVEQKYNKAHARLGKMVGYTVKIVMHDNEEFEGILDSFSIDNNSFFVVLDIFHKYRVINFNYISSIFLSGEIK